MANRRIRVLTHNEDIQGLKLGAQNSLLVQKSEDQAILFRYYRKPPTYAANVWAKFASDDLNGIHLMGYLQKNNDDIIHAANCTFKIYEISTTSTWAETLRATVSGVAQPDGKFTADIPQATLNPTELDGEITLAIEMTLKRFNRTYKKKIYVNHLGVYDSIIRLRQAVDFLFITKKDE